MNNTNDNLSLEEGIDQVFEDHLDRVIADLTYLKEEMANPGTASELRRKFRRKLEILEYFGVEFQN